MQLFASGVKHSSALTMQAEGHLPYSTVGLCSRQMARASSNSKPRLPIRKNMHCWKISLDIKVQLLQVCLHTFSAPS
jgi:hypothetical protein